MTQLPDGFAKHTYIVVEYSTLDAYLKVMFPSADACFVTDYEMSNDSEREVDINTDPFDEWDQANFDKAIAGKQTNGWGGPTRFLMQRLCQQGVLPAGRYLVGVCW